MSDDDPFEQLDADADRQGDPFERLDAPDSNEPDDASPADDPSDAPFDADQWGPPGEDRPASGGRDSPSGRTEESPSPDPGSPSDGEAGPTRPNPDREGDPDDPFSDVPTPEGNPFDAGGQSVFERVDVAGTDPDQVWASITDADEDGDPAPPPEEGRYSEVSKHAYCEGCEYFSAPPAVTCTHDTAEIIEFVDVETVRLLNCPVVAEREALERRE